MEIFGEIFVTGFVALVFSLIVAKLVSFAVSNSSTDHGKVGYGCSPGAVAEEVKLDEGLQVEKATGKKRVQLSDDVVCGKVDRCEVVKGSEIIGFLRCDEPVEGVIVEGRKNDIYEGEGKSTQFEMGSCKIECCDQREKNGTIDGDEGSESVGEFTMREGGDDENHLSVVDSKGLAFEEKQNVVETKSDELLIGEKEKSGKWGIDGNEGLCKENEEDNQHNKERVDDFDLEDNDDDDGWEGIERSELEKEFAEAVNFVEFGGKGNAKDSDSLANLGNDVLMRLHGLHKIAVEGPCNEPQPMALKVSARAKWNAWQKLGSMTEEEAMEQYIKILSDSIPGWMEDTSNEDRRQGFSEFSTSDASASLTSSFLDDERREELTATKNISTQEANAVEKDNE